MNKIPFRKSLTAIVIFSFLTLGAAFAPEVPILGKKEIAALPDEMLIDTYLDVVVEIAAVTSFHTTSGFTPKEYKTFKSLLRYRLLLIMELSKRNVQLPDFN